MGEVHWRRADGTTGEYVGPVQELGHGIPRRDTGPGIRRALFDLAFGYASGFPVRDILAYVFPGSFREAPVLEADVQALDAEHIPHRSDEMCRTMPCPQYAPGQSLDLSVPDPKEA